MLQLAEIGGTPRLGNRQRPPFLIYELPDVHPLLQELERREPDDLCPYLLIIWTSGEMSDSTDKPKTCCDCNTGTSMEKNKGVVIKEQMDANVMKIPSATPMIPVTPEKTTSTASSSRGNGKEIAFDDKPSFNQEHSACCKEDLGNSETTESCASHNINFTGGFPLEPVWKLMASNHPAVAGFIRLPCSNNDQSIPPKPVLFNCFRNPAEFSSVASPSVPNCLRQQIASASASETICPPLSPVTPFKSKESHQESVQNENDKLQNPAAVIHNTGSSNSSVHPRVAMISDKRTSSRNQGVRRPRSSAFATQNLDEQRQTRTTELNAEVSQKAERKKHRAKVIREVSRKERITPVTPEQVTPKYVGRTTAKRSYTRMTENPSSQSTPIEQPQETLRSYKRQRKFVNLSSNFAEWTEATSVNSPSMPAVSVQAAYRSTSAGQSSANHQAINENKPVKRRLSFEPQVQSISRKEAAREARRYRSIRRKASASCNDKSVMLASPAIMENSEHSHFSRREHIKMNWKSQVRNAGNELTVARNEMHGHLHNIYTKDQPSSSSTPGAILPYVRQNELLVAQGASQQLTVIPFQKMNKEREIKKKFGRAKVQLDEETKQLFELVMSNKGSEDGSHEDKDKRWEKERAIFKGRVDLFISRMTLIQGDRRFSKWIGSVLDSVVGVFLTQNVTVNLSSSAFMELAAKFPVSSSTDSSVSCPASTSTVPSDEANLQEETVKRANDLTETKDKCDIVGDNDSQANESVSKAGLEKHQFESGKEFLYSQSNARETCENINVVNSDSTGKNSYSDNVSVGVKKGKSKSKKTGVDWDSLRREAYLNGYTQERSNETMDSIDWEAVSRAGVNEVAEAIQERGMNNVLVGRIKDLLNHLKKEHGSLDLEWLRKVPPEKTKDYLLSIRGLGLKSVECVRLLSLDQHAFPVDTNVGRICVRLGWIPPIEPLPEDIQFYLVEMYPVQKNIQKYLWPRLCKLDKHTLYELHYKMIIFGKVFCTKRRPNCNACPLKGECKHFASAFASVRLALPGPEAKDSASTSVQNSDTVACPSFPLLYEGSNMEESVIGSSVPIIEYPSSPEPSSHGDVQDIEDTFDEGPIRVGETNLGVEGCEKTPTNCMESKDFPKGDIENALVSVSQKSASIPVSPLKNISRLRTEHQAYELPDDHPLLQELERREPDDPCRHLLIIWTPDTMSNRYERTIPLNGTYFQVNEVFADLQSSYNPIHVPRAWLWNLERRSVLMGTGTTAIFAGRSLEEIQSCFQRGFMCIRGFDSKTRAPKPFCKRLHFATSRYARIS